MNWRRVIYIALVVFVAAVIFRNIPDSNVEPPQKLLHQQIILKDFKDLQNQVYKEKGNYKPDSIYFPYDYTGDRGDEFYLTVKNENNVATLKYVVQENSQGELEYLQKNRWEDVTLPLDRFESYQYQDNDWVNINLFD